MHWSKLAEIDRKELLQVIESDREAFARRETLRLRARLRDLGVSDPDRFQVVVPTA